MYHLEAPVPRKSALVFDFHSVTNKISFKSIPFALGDPLISTSGLVAKVRIVRSTNLSRRVRVPWLLPTH
jgi:hypothetical protein